MLVMLGTLGNLKNNCSRFDHVMPLATIENENKQ